MTQRPVWILEIDRGQRRNSIDSDTARNLGFMLHEANSTPHCKAVVLAGKGAWFCAGSDLKELAGRTPSEMAGIETAKADLARMIQEIDLPVVAAVEGFALGGGVSLAASCDIVVSGRQARWHMPEVLNGWLAPWGIEPVVRRCGEMQAKRVLWGAEAMTAEMAHQFGLVDQLVEDGTALQKALAIAEQLACLPPIASRSVKQYMRSRDPARQEAADGLASQFFVNHCATEQAQSTLAKFGKSK